MADEMDPNVSAAYRELGAEEPPPALDRAILAASRNPPARSWSQRWAVPVSLAAVLVLTVGVALRIDREAPELRQVEAPRAEAPAAGAARIQEADSALKLKAEDQLRARAKRPEAEAARAVRQERPEPKAFADAAPKPAAPAPASPAVAAAQAPASTGSSARNDVARGDIGELARREPGRGADAGGLPGSPLRSVEERTARDAEAAARAHQAGALLAKRRADSPVAAESAAAPPPAPAAAPAKLAPAPAAKLAEQAAQGPADTPEREFERIAQLRAAGRHEEADKAFLEFRRRYPSFRITEEMLRRVERR
jgi:hypothetical protein